MARTREREEREGGVVKFHTGPVEGADAALIINDAILLHRNFKTFLESLDKLAGRDDLSRSELERTVKSIQQADEMYHQASLDFIRPEYSGLGLAIGLDKQDAAIFAGFQFVQASWLGIVAGKFNALDR